MNDRISIKIWTDGSCTTQGRKGGGFGVYCKVGDEEITLRRGYYNTTTTRMEMMAILAAIRMVDPNEFTHVIITSDSQFCVNAFKLGWLANWRMKGWKGVKNVDIWKDILREIESRRKMKFGIKWLPGHENNLNEEDVFGNNVADSLANYKTQDKWEQDLDLVGYSWFCHESSDSIFIEKTDRFEELNKMGDVCEIGPCVRANFEELFDLVNGTYLFDALWEQKLDVNYNIEEII